jgi:hypothetical protein
MLLYVQCGIQNTLSVFNNNLGNKKGRKELNSVTFDVNKNYVGVIFAMRRRNLAIVNSLVLESNIRLLKRSREVKIPAQYYCTISVKGWI